jgi:hypothetical protein
VKRQIRDRTNVRSRFGHLHSGALHGGHYRG